METTHFDIIEKDFKLTIEQEEAIVHVIHSLNLEDASIKRIYNEITTKGYGQKQLRFAFMVVGFYEALRMVGVIFE